MKTTDRLDRQRREMRQFGLGLGLLLLLLGTALLWHGRAAGWVVLCAGPVMCLALWCNVPGAKPFYLAWMKMAGLLGMVMTTILLVLIYLLVLTPIALLARVSGHQFIARTFRESKETYWLKRLEEAPRNSYEKQS